MRKKIDCPECGEKTIRVLKKTQHSSRSSFSGGVTFKLFDEECSNCGFSDVKKSLKSKGFHIK